MIELEQYENIDRETLLDGEIILEIVTTKDEIEKNHLKIFFDDIARKLKCYQDFNKLYKAYNKKRITDMKSMDSNKTKFSDTDIVLSCGCWEATDTGIFMTVFRGENECREYACTHPIFVEKLYINYEDKTESVKLSFNSKGYFDSIVVPKSTIANRNKIVALSDYGVEVTSESAKNLVNYLSDLCSLNDIKTVKATDKLGWKGQEFVPYDESYHFLGELSYKDLFESITEKGDYNLWLSYTKNIIQKSIVARIVLLTSLASPFVDRMGILPFILHLWGGTESGKTVSLMLGASVWGDPELGKLVKSLNNTHVSLERMADTLNNFPIFCDELQLIKHQRQYKNGYDSLIMTLCQGIGKGRGNAFGSIDKTTSWKNLFLFTGEEPITSDNLGGGSKNRVVEIEASGKIIENGMETSNFYRQNYGFMGKKIIELYRNNADEFRAVYDECFKMLLDKTSDKQAMAFALIMMIDKMVSKEFFQIEPLNINDIKDYLKDKSEISTTKRSYDFILSVISKNKIRFNNDMEVNKGEIWGFISDDDYCYFDKKTLEDCLRDNHFSFNAVKKGWLDNGYLELNTQGRYFHQRKMNNITVMLIKMKLPNFEDITKEEMEMFEQQNL